jgi:hypothetical protein
VVGVENVVAECQARLYVVKDSGSTTEGVLQKCLPCANCNDM